MASASTVLPACAAAAAPLSPGLSGSSCWLAVSSFLAAA